jgi:hypothetical protein
VFHGDQFLPTPPSFGLTAWAATDWPPNGFEHNAAGYKPGAKGIPAKVQNVSGLRLPAFRYNTLFWRKLVLPKSSVTAGGLARAAAVLNFKMLIDQTKTFRRDDVWRALIWFFEECFAVDGQLIVRGTRFT